MNFYPHKRKYEPAQRISGMCMYIYIILCGSYKICVFLGANSLRERCVHGTSDHEGVVVCTRSLALRFARREHGSWMTATRVVPFTAEGSIND